VGSTHSKTGARGSVRIIGGRWRRHRIAIVAGADLRPTPDRVRETLFNWLTPVLAGSRCLDLYAGTGVLGFEALSRGAAQAVFVDNNRDAIRALQRQRDELAAAAEIVGDDALVYLADFAADPFDIVFLDPPYACAIEPVLAALGTAIKPNTLLYLERKRDQAWPEIAGWEWRRLGTAGDVAFGIAAIQAPQSSM